MRSSLFAPKWHLVSRVLLRVYRLQQEVGDTRLLLFVLVVILVSLMLAGMVVAA